MTKFTKMYKDGTARTVDTEHDGFWSILINWILDIIEDKEEAKKK